MEKDYLKALAELKSKFSSFIETDNTEELKPLCKVGDIIICINNNFIKDVPSHGPKDGLTLGKFYKILSIRDGDMIVIKNDFLEDVPYFNWRFDMNVYVMNISF